MQYVVIAQPVLSLHRPQIVATHSSIEGIRDLTRLHRQTSPVEHLDRFEVVHGRRVVEVIDPVTLVSSLPAPRGH